MILRAVLHDRPLGALRASHTTMLNSYQATSGCVLRVDLHTTTERILGLVIERLHTIGFLLLSKYCISPNL